MRLPGCEGSDLGYSNRSIHTANSILGKKKSDDGALLAD